MTEQQYPSRVINQVTIKKSTLIIGLLTMLAACSGENGTTGAANSLQSSHAAGVSSESAVPASSESSITSSLSSSVSSAISSSSFQVSTSLSSSVMSVGSVSSVAISSSSASSVSSASQPVVDGCLESPLNSGYCLVWQDEFTSAAVDSSKWSYERNCFGGGNNEAQCYVDSPENVWVDGDLLHIKAIREDVTGPSMLDDASNYSPDDTSGSGSYTSGRLRTVNKGDWKYGRFDIRAKLPYGQGTWPAIWMLPTDNAYGGWASSGEIDIMEVVNLKVGGEDRIYGTLHYGDNYPNNVYSGENYRLSEGDGSDDFHVYSLEWEEGEIRWYVDGDHYATQTSAGWYSMAALDDPHAPFNQRFHLLLNFAVGGDWAGTVNATGIDESVFPQEMQVDYVRVYQCTHDRESGKGCATRDENYINSPGITPPDPVDVSGDTITLFDGNTYAPYQWRTYSDGGNVAYQVIDGGDEKGKVGKITFNTDQGIGFFQSDSSVDLSSFSAIEFDLKITADPRDVKSDLMLRLDCTWPCTSGDYSIGYPLFDTWMHYRVLLSELQKGGLDVKKVNTPFVIAPAYGNQMGVVLEVDNVRISK